MRVDLALGATTAEGRAYEEGWAVAFHARTAGEVTIDVEASCVHDDDDCDGSETYEVLVFSDR